MSKRHESCPGDGAEAFYQGFQLDDNPWPEWDGRFEEFDEDFLETTKHYEEESFS